MADFGIMQKVRGLLQNNQHLKDQQLDQHIYLSVPQEQRYPMIMIELEEIWSTPMKAGSGPVAKVKFKASSYSRHISATESMALADVIRLEVDGKVLQLEDGKTAVFRLDNSVIDTPIANKPRCVHQYYQGIVRQ